MANHIELMVLLLIKLLMGMNGHGGYMVKSIDIMDLSHVGVIGIFMVSGLDTGMVLHANTSRT